MGELVLIPRDLAERVTEIANRNEQSAEGDRLAALLSSPTTPLPEDAARVERYSMSTQGPFDREPAGLEPDNDGDWVLYSDYQSLSSQLAEARAELKMLHTHNLAERDRLAADLERKVAVAKEALEATREAIALHRSYERTPTDRGGSLGPKGKARSAWIEAEAFAEGRVDTALASLKDQNNDE